jgi:LysM repeat protein
VGNGWADGGPGTCARAYDPLVSAERRPPGNGRGPGTQQVEASAPERQAPPPPVAPPMAPESDVAPLSGDDWLDVICPYIRSADGTWRAATPVRDHRCFAMDPATEIPFLTQQRLCLTSEHAGCERFAHAQERRVAALARDRIAPERVEAARFGPFASGVPLAVEPQRPDEDATAAVGSTSPPRRMRWVAFGGAGALGAVLLLAVLLAGATRPITPLASPSPTGVAETAGPGPSATPRRSASPRPGRSPGGVRSYTVKEGDTLRSIAKRFELTVLELRALNPDLDESLKQRDPLEPGTTLVVPRSNGG